MARGTWMAAYTAKELREKGIDLRGGYPRDKKTQDNNKKEGK